MQPEIGDASSAGFQWVPSEAVSVGLQPRQLPSTAADGGGNCFDSANWGLAAAGSEQNPTRRQDPRTKEPAACTAAAAVGRRTAESLGASVPESGRSRRAPASSV